MTSAISSYVPSASAPSRARALNLKYVNFGILASLAGLGVFYLVNVSSLTVMGFVLKDLKSEAASLAATKLAKEEEVNRVRSYQELSSRTQGLNMVAIGEVEYISAPDGSVARK